MRLALVCLLLGAVGAAACDSVLLELLRDQGRSSDFDRRVEDLSKLIVDIGDRVRNHGGSGALGMRSTFTNTWASLYERFYLSPPPGHEANPHWRAMCDTVGSRCEELRRLTRDKDWVNIHAALRATQDALTAFYIPAPSRDRPDQEVALLRSLAKGLARVAAAKEPIAADLRSTHAQMAARLTGLRSWGMVPPEGSPQALAWDRASAAFLEAVAKAPASTGPMVAELGICLEALLAAVPPGSGATAPPTPGTGAAPAAGGPAGAPGTGSEGSR